ncbi:XrtA/PEP-CTERM system-associated ATPase [Parasphingopyxis lamellibrachiae]|uniref:Putative secretion ATPase (PEP-CTERM system associated) n=1 Tax=Parasphingopyxis lamellibrachiae TaxID=680125 RepID=A0A3D9FDM2_9SPHN|nr:XrtA/PEP-CTERM system-associated ATPase [Parasphingopyxis lamellibrachiae]RED15667.1 putative secretion ATPase (PEP-CTERM system associated) [Parasphingopyxis lamellibrachiae]
MYSEHYGLTGNPFQLTPDHRFWFESETHKKAMAYLGYGLAQGEGFIVITGDIGAGKTTLVGHLMASIDTSRLTAVQVVSTQVEGDDMLRLVSQQLGLEVHGFQKAELIDRVERFLHGQAREGKRTLLIVDEAQNLSVSALEELRMLSNFQSAGRALLQIFLLGQPEFRDRVKKAPNLEQLRQRVIATHHLDAMQANEIEPYIVHRLSIAGWQGAPQFAADAYAALYEATDGVPRRLNTLMGRVMLFGAVEDLETIDAAAINAVLTDLAGDETEGDAMTVEFDETVEPETIEELPVDEGVEAEVTQDIADADIYAALAAAELQETPALDEETEDPMPFSGHAEPADPAIAEENGPDIEIDSRIAALETRLEEQEAALRRVLTLLVQWVEEEETQPSFGVVRGDAA